MSKKQPKEVEWDPSAYVATKKAANEARLRDKLAEKGGSPFLKLDSGENTFTLLRREPGSRLSSFNKEQAVFFVEKDGKPYEWTVTESSPLFAGVLDLLAVAPCPVTVIRVGKGQGTRLDLK